MPGSHEDPNQFAVKRCFFSGKPHAPDETRIQDMIISAFTSIVVGGGGANCAKPNMSYTARAAS